MPHPIALVDNKGWLHAWILDLPGCLTGARDLGSLATAVPLAIAEHHAWLRLHGEHPAEDEAFEIVERLDTRDYVATGGGFVFAADHAPLETPELEQHLLRMNYTHADFIEALREVPDIILDWDPGDGTVEHADPWAPEARTIRGIVTHNLQLEVFYRGAIRDGPAPGILEAVLGPASERATTLGLLRSMDDEARNRIYLPVHPGRTVAEQWTVRKTIRRLISHERHHTAEIRQRLSWLLVGVPGNAD